jgi:hypothetical protein
MTVLATMFDSLRGFLKIVGRKRLYFMQTRVPDGTMVRVAGIEFAQVVQVTKDKTTGTYDVVVDDAPTSPNVKEANWAVMQPMMTVFKDQLAASPELLVLAMEYSPLPTAFVEAIKKTLAQTQQSDQTQQQWRETMQQLAIAKLTAEINKDQSTAEMQNAKAGATTSTATYDLAMAQNLLAKNDISGFEHHIKAMSGAAKAELDKAKAAQTIAQTHQDMQQTDIDRRQHHSDMLDAATNRAATRHSSAIETQGALADAHQAQTARHQAVTDRIMAHMQARQQALDSLHQTADREQQGQQIAGDQSLQAQQMAQDQEGANQDRQLKAQQLRQQDQHNQRTSDIQRLTAQAALQAAQNPGNET